jgi:hypothetical protein
MAAEMALAQNLGIYYQFSIGTDGLDMRRRQSQHGSEG